MQGNQAISLGPNHGYRFEGDMAFLNAELAIAARERAEANGWALQLWACDAPYQGGPLLGIKVAEAALALDGAQVAAEAPAQLPPAQRDYAMVLVLASGAAGSYDQVHDFSNYPARQAFAVPHLNGSAGYRFEDEHVVLQVEGVRNPRVPGNLSGTLALELWALRSRYEGAALDGVRVAHGELGRLAGNDEQRGVELRSTREALPAGEWQLALLLREWTEGGYQTRDFCNFATPYRVEQAPAVEPVRVIAAPQPVAAPEPVVAPEPVAAPVAAVEPAKPARLALKAKLSVSKASAEELAKVKGLNAKLAQAIVRARPFNSFEDLMRVRGIGDKLLQTLRAQLTL